MKLFQYLPMLFKIPLYDNSNQLINILRISRLLSRFNIKENEKNIGKMLGKLSEEAELEEFEQYLYSPPKKQKGENK
jgi:hypothetical protein